MELISIETFSMNSLSIEFGSLYYVIISWNFVQDMFAFTYNIINFKIFNEWDWLNCLIWFTNWW